jgi:hypothetical protein
LCCFNKFVDYDSRWGDAAQALAQNDGIQRLLVKPWMCSIGRCNPALYRRIPKAIEIASNLPEFFVAVDSLSPTNIAKHSYNSFKLKQRRSIVY